MSNNYRQGTATMAKLFADQGHWEKAADIYRYLLAREPGREDFARALAEADSHVLTLGSNCYADDLAPLFRQWIDLLLKYKQVGRLRRISGALRNTENRSPV